MQATLGRVLSFVARYAAPRSACRSIDKGGPLIKINALVVNDERDVELSARPSIPISFEQIGHRMLRRSRSPATTLPREYPDVCQTFSCRDLSESAPTNWPAWQKARPSFRRVRIPAGCYRNRRIPFVAFCVARLTGELSLWPTRKISLLRVMKRRGNVRENTTAARLNGIIHCGHGERTSSLAVLIRTFAGAAKSSPRS